MHFDGTLWSSVTGFGTGFGFNTALGFSSTDFWGFGDDGSTHHWDGTTWTAPFTPTTTLGPPPPGLFIAHASGPSDIYVPVTDGSIIHWDGTGWSRSILAAGTELFSAWVDTPTNVWVVGRHGIILNGDASGGFTTVSAADATSKFDLNSNWGFAANNIWAVGGGGTIIHYSP
jgi:hypothetical protein